MTNPEVREEPTDFIAIIREDINNAPQKIAAEIERGSGNDWLAALTSRLQIALGNAQLAEVAGQLSAEKSQQVKTVVNRLTEEIRDYRRDLAVADNLPEDFKTGMINELRSILEIL